MSRRLLRTQFTGWALASALILSLGCGDPHAGNTVGVTSNERGAFEGYTLFNRLRGDTVWLIANDGQVVHQWELERRVVLAKLIENGHLLTVGHGDELTGGVREFDREGRVVWEFAYPGAEVDVLKLPNGNVLFLARDERPREEFVRFGVDPDSTGAETLRGLRLVEVRPSGNNGGEVVWEWSVWDHLVQDFDPEQPNYGVVAEHPERVDANFAVAEVGEWWNPPDWLHPNAIAYNAELDQIMVSVRHFSELWVIDHAATTEEAAGSAGGRGGMGGDLLYRWGNPAAYRTGSAADRRLFWQHAPHWIPPGSPGAGNILVFNNGADFPPNGRRWTSVDEIVPPFEGSNYRREAGGAWGPAGPMWSWSEEPPGEFYAQFLSGAQRLPNGNTLLCDGMKGTMFEVTPRGQTVWRYVSPVTGSGVLRQGEVVPPLTDETSNPDLRRDGVDATENIIFRCHRYAPDDPRLAGLDLTPKGTIELPPAP